MSDLVGNPEDRFSHDAAHIKVNSSGSKLQREKVTYPFQNKIEVGDVLDEMCGQCLRGKGKMTLQSTLEDYQGLPIHIAVIKSYDKEGYQFAQIKKLLDKSNISDPLSPNTPKSDSLFDWEEKPPPEAILPEDVADEVPVHDSEGR